MGESLYNLAIPPWEEFLVNTAHDSVAEAKTLTREVSFDGWVAAGIYSQPEPPQF